MLNTIPKKDSGKILSYLRDITSEPCIATERERLREAVEALQKPFPKAAGIFDDHGEEILAVYALPEHHRKRMRTTNMLERFNEEIKRRTRVIRIFPNE